MGLRLALIGCGGISRAHLDGIRQLDGLVEVVAVCDTDRGAAAQAAARAGGGPAVCERYQEVLARDDVQAVDILLPHHLHAPVTLAAAAAGKHVLCEKPNARTRAEARQMIQAAQAAGIKLMVAYCERYANEYQAAHALLQQGAIGPLHLSRIDHNQWVSPPAGHWLTDPEALGGGAVAGSGTHRLDLLRWFNGEVARVAAFAANTGVTTGRGEDVAAISLEFANGAVGEMAISWSCRRFPWYEGLWLYGEQGVIHNVGGLQLSRLGADGQATEYEPVPLPHDDRGGFREEIRHFAECVLENRQPLTDGEQALRTLELVEAVYRAATTRQVVSLPLPEDESGSRTPNI